ncbi:hypothetical protein ACFL2V_09420 [Pseudomonadota bacterium]
MPIESLSQARIPKNMPQLKKLERAFANFMRIHNALAARMPNDYQDLCEFISSLSTDDLEVHFSRHENIEGSFYFKDKRSGISMRWRPNGLMTYIYDESGRELFYVRNLDPEQGEGIMQRLVRIQEKSVSSISESGIDVVYQTPEDRAKASELAGFSEKLRQIREEVRKGFFNRHFNKPLMQLLDLLIEKTPDPYFNHEDQVITKGVYTAFEAETIFKKCLELITAATKVLEEQISDNPV